MKRTITLIVAIVALALPASAQQADTIYYHGKILTGSHLRPDDASTTPPMVEAMLLHAGKVVAVGSNDEILAKKTDATSLIDLHGAFVMPGFNDAHTHIAFAGQQHLSVDLDNVPSLAAMQAKIKAYAITLAPGAWILGGGWDHTKWTSQTLPTAHDLDAVSDAHPAYLERTDGHIAVLNTAALAAAHITAPTKAPTGGAIDLDASGQPTGIVRDAALTLVRPIIPKPDDATRRRALQLSIDDALAHGVTSVQDYSDWADFLVLEQMEKEGELPLRISEWLTFNDSLDTLKAERAHHDLNDPLLHTGMLKGFMDGSLGSRTAAMLAPYSDDSKNSGLARYDQDKLNSMTIERAAAGFQIGFHAIGDKANTMALDAIAAVDASNRIQYEEILKRGTYSGKAFSDAVFRKLMEKSRNRIEHSQVVSRGDFNRFAQLGVIASMQPVHLLTDMAWAGDRLGPERSKYAYAWKSFLNHGVLLAFGTDYPVESINPFSRSIRGDYPPERNGHADLSAAGKDHAQPSTLCIYTGLGIRGVSRDQQRTARARIPGRLRRTGPRHHQGHAAGTAEYEGGQHRNEWRSSLHGSCACCRQPPPQHP